MAAAQQRDHQAGDDGVLADDGLADLLAQREQRRTGVRGRHAPVTSAMCLQVSAQRDQSGRRPWLGTAQQCGDLLGAGRCAGGAATTSPRGTRRQAQPDAQALAGPTRRCSAASRRAAGSVAAGRDPPRLGGTDDHRQRLDDDTAQPAAAPPDQHAHATTTCSSTHRTHDGMRSASSVWPPGSAGSDGGGQPPHELVVTAEQVHRQRGVTPTRRGARWSAGCPPPSRTTSVRRASSTTTTAPARGPSAVAVSSSARPRGARPGCPTYHSHAAGTSSVDGLGAPSSAQGARSRAAASEGVSRGPDTRVVGRRDQRQHRGRTAVPMAPRAESPGRRRRRSPRRPPECR